MLTAATGRHDKIEIRIAGSVRYAYAVDHSAFMKAVSSKAINPKIFNAAQGPRGRPTLHRVAKNDWLFAGRLRYLNGDTPLRERRFQLELSINPTRFASHVARFGLENVADLASLPPESLLVRDTNTRKALEAKSHGGWDNHIPSSPWMSSVTKNWPTLCDIYVDAIYRFILENLTTVGAEALPENPPYIQLDRPRVTCPIVKHAEVYWEMGARDARKAYYELCHGMRLAAPAFRERERFDILSGQAVRSRWMSIHLRQGVKLTVYLKTAGLLRLEITYAPGKGERGSLWEMARYGGDIDGSDLSSRLELLRRDAAARLNEVLNALPEITASYAPPPYNEIAATLAAISVACGGAKGLIANIVGQLTEEGVLSAGIGSPPVRKAADALCKAGVLQRVTITARSTVARYVPVGPSANVFTMLRGSTM